MDRFNVGGADEGGSPFQGIPRNSRPPYNDNMDERGAPPPNSFSNSNGILSRPSGMAPLPREDSFVTGQGSGSIPNNRGAASGQANQPHHEVFMVREASRSSLIPTGASTPDRLPFAGAPADPLNLGGGGDREPPTSHSIGGSKSSRHSRSDRSGGGEKEGKLSLPKMLKIAVIGDSTSGKTGICNAFTSEGYSFSRNYHMTTGVSIYAKSIKLPVNRGGGDDGRDPITGGGDGPGSSTEDTLILEPRINLVLVDSAGKPLYRELLAQYWDRLDGFALVIDLTSSTALEACSAWLSLAKDSMKVAKSRQLPVTDETGGGDQSGAGGSSKRGGMDYSPILGVLIGAKSDLKEQRVISPKAAQDFASQQGLQYFECSAKDNSGMEEPFFYLAHQWATTTSSSSLSGSFEKENAPAAGGIFPKNSGHNNSSSSSRRSVFASRQSSSEGF